MNDASGRCTNAHQAFKETCILSENTPAPGRLRLSQHVTCGGGHSASSLQQRKRATSQTTLMTGSSPHPWTIPSFHSRPGRRKTAPRDRPTGVECTSQHTAATLLGTTHWWREEGQVCLPQSDSPRYTWQKSIFMSTRHQD